MKADADVAARASGLGLSRGDALGLARYVRHVRKARIRSHSPLVTENYETAGSSKWHVKFGGLYVVPSMTAGARKLKSVWEFTRKYSLRGSGAEVLKVPMAGLLDKAWSDRMSGLKGLPELVSEAVGPKLDELDAELRALHAEFVRKARDAYDSHVRSPGRRKGALHGLVRAIRRGPGIRKLDPAFVVQVLTVDREALHALLGYMGSSDSLYADEDVVREAFGLFDARSILES